MIITDANLGTTRAAGNGSRLNGPLVAIRQIFETVDRVALPRHLDEKIEAIREQRAGQSQAFFSRHSEQFREQQELIAAFDLYAEPTAELIRKRAARQSWLSVLEIGPGEGGFLPVLSELFQHVVGLVSLLRRRLSPRYRLW